MNDAFLNGSTHLMKSWKKLRAELTSDLSDYDHLIKVCNFWKLAPISAMVLDWDRPKEWPTAWEFISKMEFDESSVALGMMYTLLLSKDDRWNSDRCKLFLIKDDSRKIQKIILLVDNKWLLNYEYKTILDVENKEIKFAIQQRYFYNGKIHSIED